MKTSAGQTPRAGEQLWDLQAVVIEKRPGLAWLWTQLAVIDSLQASRFLFGPVQKESRARIPRILQPQQGLRPSRTARLYETHRPQPRVDAAGEIFPQQMQAGRWHGIFDSRNAVGISGGRGEFKRKRDACGPTGRGVTQNHQAIVAAVGDDPDRAGESADIQSFRSSERRIRGEAPLPDDAGRPRRIARIRES